MIHGIFFRDYFGRVFLHGEVVKDLDKKSKILIRQREMSPPLTDVEAARFGTWLSKVSREVTIKNHSLVVRRIAAKQGKRKKYRGR